jgi:hypothetical protein
MNFSSLKNLDSNAVESEVESRACLMAREHALDAIKTLPVSEKELKILVMYLCILLKRMRLSSELKADCLLFIFNKGGSVTTQEVVKKFLYKTERPALAVLQRLADEEIIFETSGVWTIKSQAMLLAWQAVKYPESVDLILLDYNSPDKGATRKARRENGGK